jgi:DNA-binding NarL/FixJ family response regulator
VPAATIPVGVSELPARAHDLRPPVTTGAAPRRARLHTAARAKEVATELLTPRQTEVIKHIAEAFPNEDIANALTISPRTVERHLENILRKLGMRDRVQLTRYAIRRGLVEP